MKRQPLSLAGINELNRICDEFRRLVKEKALESTGGGERTAGAADIVNATRNVCNSNWALNFEMRDGRADKAA